MLLIKIISFLFGYVSFSARSGFPERFINLCRLNKIPLRNLKCSDSVLTAETDRNSYKRIRPVAKKSGMKVRIEKKHGLPFFLNRHRHRFGLIIGAVFCGIAVLFLSTRIWRIEVTGNNRVSAEEITAVFAKLGIREGAPSNDVNASEIEAAALRDLPDISWLNINFSGCTAMIEVRETVEKPKTDNDNMPSNLVASRDGQILILRPFNGTAEAAVGMSVLKGDLLISGIEENKDLSASFCKAEGYVVAKTVRNSDFVMPMQFPALQKTETKKSRTLHFLFFNIPVGKKLSSGFSESSSLCIKNIALPLGITKTVENTCAEFNCELSEKDALLLASLRFGEARLEEFRGMEIENSRISIEIENNSVRICGEFDCTENIGADSVMQIEEKPI